MQLEEQETRLLRQLSPSCGYANVCGDLNAEVLRSQQKLLRKKENGGNLCWDPWLNRSGRTVTY